MSEDLQKHLRDLQVLFNARDYARVIAQGRALTTKFPAEPAFHHTLGNALATTGDFKAAALSFDTVIKLNPQSVDAHVAAGAVQKNLGNLSGAITYTHKAHVLAPANPDVLDSLGKLLYKAGNLADAEKVFAAAFTLDGRRLESARNLAAVLEQQGRLDEALAVYGRMLALVPGDAKILRTIVRMSMQLGRLDTEHVRITCAGRELKLQGPAAFEHLAEVVGDIPQYLLRLPDAFCVSPNLVVAGGALLDAANGHDTLTLAVHVHESYPLKYTGYDGKLEAGLTLPAARVDLPHPAGILSANANYASWLLGELPRIFLYEKADDLSHLALHGGARPFHLASLAFFGFDAAKITAVDESQALGAAPLYVATPTFRNYAYAFPALAHLRSQFETRKSAAIAAQPRRSIYVSRSKLGAVHDRRIANEQEVEAFLAGHGFDIVHPQELPFEDQIMAFATADRIVAPFGAALANALFSRRGAKMGVIATKTTTEFDTLFRWLGLETRSIGTTSRQAREGANMSQTHEHTVNLDDLKALL